MKILFLTLFTCFYLTIVLGQTNSGITAIDFVKVKNARQKEALYFYENNWKIYRDIAIQKGFIKSYRLLSTTADSATNFDLILITEYADSSQLKLSEERFQTIIKETRPNGPMLLNEFKPSDFRQNISFKHAETLFTSDKKQKKKNSSSK